MPEGMSRHAQPVQRIDAGLDVAERLQDPREGRNAARQRTGRALRETNRAQRPVIEALIL